MNSKFKVCLLGILAMFCLIPDLAFAQNMRVQGTVKDETGEPMFSVTVMVQGTGTGSVTDFDGHFDLPSVPRGATLEFSYVGYQKKTVKVDGRVLNVTMVPDAQNLEEVVVVAYGQQKKVTITGAVSAVGGEELLKSPTASVANSLQGKLPGVQSVQYSGIPGGDEPVLRVRGVGSINSAEPLVLVDGVERGFSQLDPNEIQDISILKDASATAVFGVRGANGVILVTTKRGQTGKPSVSFTASAGMQQITHFIETVDAYTYATAFNGAQASDGLSKDQLKFSDEAIKHFKDHDMPYVYPDTNWFDYIMKNTAWQQQYNISVSGGTDKAKYFVSVGYMNQDGLFKTFNTGDHNNFSFNRYNYRANLDLQLTKISSLSLSVGGRVQNRTEIGDGESNLFTYLQDATPFSSYGIDEFGRHIKTDPALVADYGRDGLETFYNLGYNMSSQNVLNLDLQYKLDMSFLTKGLDFRAKASYNHNFTHQKNMRSGYGTGEIWRATVDRSQTDENGNPLTVFAKEGVTWPNSFSDNKWLNQRNWYAEASFNYNRKFGSHNVGALLLYNQSKRYYPGGTYNDTPSGYVGLVGRVTYDYANKYMVDMNMGYNGSENFAPGKRYGFFPSASIGWVPSEEKFWSPVKNIITFMKLRASWGKVGNDATAGQRFLYLPSAWQFLGGSYYNASTGMGTANFGIKNPNWLPGVYEATAGNPDVTWETAFKQNYGVDMKFLNDRLSVNFDLFFEDRKNILLSNASTLPDITNLKSSYVNFGRVKNHGYEINVRWNDRIGNVTYYIAPALTFARNEVIENGEVKPQYDYLSRKGHPVGQPFGRVLFGFYQEGVTEKLYKEQMGEEMPAQGIAIKNGDCVYVDLNHDGKIDADDMKAIGYTDVPEYNASVNMGFSWKNFDFSMSWVGAWNVSRNMTRYFRPQFGTNNNAALSKWVYENSWTPETAETAILPRLTFSNIGHNASINWTSTVWVRDAAYARLKNVELGYTFRKIIPQISSLRLYVSGYNLLTFTSFKGNDPESGDTRYPMTRVYNFGVKVNF